MIDKLGEKLSAIQLHYDLLTVVREEIGMTDHFAEQIAAAIVRGLCRLRGGQDIYIPAEDKIARDERIRSEFNGRNRREVMEKFGIKKSRLYEISRSK